MKIGELAKAAGVSAQTVRFYEREGLIPEPERLANGYRRYPTGAVERVTFICRCADAGFTLREIRRLIEMGEMVSTRKCGVVAELLDEKIKLVKQRMEALKDLGDRLASLRSRCEMTKDGDPCRAMESLAKEPRRLRR